MLYQASCTKNTRKWFLHVRQNFLTSCAKISLCCTRSNVHVFCLSFMCLRTNQERVLVAKKEKHIIEEIFENPEVWKPRLATSTCSTIVAKSIHVHTSKLCASARATVSLQVGALRDLLFAEVLATPPRHARRYARDQGKPERPELELCTPPAPRTPHPFPLVFAESNNAGP